MWAHAGPQDVVVQLPSSSLSAVADARATISAAIRRGPDVETPLLAASRSAPVWTLALNNQLTAPPAYIRTRTRISPSRAIASSPTTSSVARSTGSCRRSRCWSRPSATACSSSSKPSRADGAARQRRHRRRGSSRSPGALSVPPVWDNGWLIVATRDRRGARVPRDRTAISSGAAISDRRRTPGPRSPPIASYVPLDDGRIVALRVDTGEPLWERRLGGRRTTSARARRSALRRLERQLLLRSEDDGRPRRLALADRRRRHRPPGRRRAERATSSRSTTCCARCTRKSGVAAVDAAAAVRPTRGPVAAPARSSSPALTPTLRAFNMKDGAPAGDAARGPASVAQPPHAVPMRRRRCRRLARSCTRDIAQGRDGDACSRGSSIQPLQWLDAAAKRACQCCVRWIASRRPIS